MKTIYHVSKTENLKVLEPRVCSHQTPYVYASYKLETSLLFGGGLWSDWDFIYKRNYETQELKFSETYPGAFEQVFKNKSCILYELENSGFEQGKTNMWDEIVSTHPTKVLKETKIDDLYKEIVKLASEGKITLETYNDTPEYKQKVKAHILNLAKYSNIYKQHNTPLLLKHFESLIKEKNK